MCIYFEGRIKEIERHYKESIEKHGIKCKIFNTKSPDFDKKIKNVDAGIVFTNTVSHKMAAECSKIFRKNNIIIKTPHSSSMCKLEEAVKEIKKYEII